MQQKNLKQNGNVEEIAAVMNFYHKCETLIIMFNYLTAQLGNFWRKRQNMQLAEWFVTLGI